MSCTPKISLHERVGEFPVIFTLNVLFIKLSHCRSFAATRVWRQVIIGNRFTRCSVSPAGFGGVWVFHLTSSGDLLNWVALSSSHWPLTPRSYTFEGSLVSSRVSYRHCEAPLHGRPSGLGTEYGPKASFASCSKNRPV